MVLGGRVDTRPPVDAATACYASGLNKVYGTRETAVHALYDVTLTIPRSAFTAIMGPSGSGKSTLLHCLAALDTPTSGRVFLGGTELTALSRRQQAQVRRDRIGFVFQSFNLVPTLNALENITLPQLLAGRRPDRAWLHHVIARIGLGDRLHHRPSELSGGQQQRIALARALAGRPEVIFADEPTGNLDTTASREMLTLLRDAVDRFDQTVVTVTHDPSIASYADQILYFSDGRVVDRTNGRVADHTLDRPQQEDGVDGGDGRHDQRLPARRRSDGQQTMRSRRRRQPDEPTPGRPMVGSDDEVEVARQERWLQRIREQFEAEYAAREQVEATPDDTIQQPANWIDHADPSTDPRPPASHDDDWHQRSDPPRHDAIRDPYAGLAHHTTGDPHQDQAHHDTGQPHEDQYGDPHGPRQAYTDVHGDVQRWQDDVRHGVDGYDDARSRAPMRHPAADADGWLPPERAPLYAADEPRADDDPDGHTDTDRWRTDTVTRSEIAPWSRPTADEADEHQETHQSEASGWRVTGDPWAPADEHLAEEYRSERSTGRRPRGWQDDGGDIWSTGRWEAQADDRHDEPGRHQAGDAGSDDHDPGDHNADPSAASDAVTPPVWQVEAGRSDSPLAHWRDDDGREAPPAPHGGQRNGRSSDAAPPAINGHDRDPWTNVWDAHAAPDLGEVWTPAFDHSRPVNGNGHLPVDARPDEPPAWSDPDRQDDGRSPAVTDPWASPSDDAPTAADGRPVEDLGRPAEVDAEVMPDPHHNHQQQPAERHPALPEARHDQTPDEHHDQAPDAGPPIPDDHPHHVTPADVPVDDVRTPTPRMGASRRQPMDPTPPVHAEPGTDDAVAVPSRHRPEPSEVTAFDSADHRGMTDPADAPDGAAHHQHDTPDPTDAPSAAGAPGAAAAAAGPPRAEPTATPPADPPARPADATVPPPLASLRNTRRPGESQDAMAALQSLQEQLDRLGGTDRRAARRPRRGGHGTTDRSGR